jgi:hypothetical protein
MSPTWRQSLVMLHAIRGSLMASNLRVDDESPD